jgi:membrane protease YdiL (CAAX protease family)
MLPPEDDPPAQVEEGTEEAQPRRGSGVEVARPAAPEQLGSALFARPDWRRELPLGLLLTVFVGATVFAIVVVSLPLSAWIVWEKIQFAEDRVWVVEVRPDQGAVAAVDFQMRASSVLEAQGCAVDQPDPGLLVIDCDGSEEWPEEALVEVAGAAAWTVGSRFDRRKRRWNRARRERAAFVCSWQWDSAADAEALARLRPWLESVGDAVRLESGGGEVEVFEHRWRLESLLRWELRRRSAALELGVSDDSFSVDRGEVEGAGAKPAPDRGLALEIASLDAFDWLLPLLLMATGVGLLIMVALARHFGVLRPAPEHRSSTPRALAWGAAGGVVIFLGNMALGLLMGQDRFREQEVLLLLGELRPAPLFLALFGAVLLAPVAEELFFRRVLFRTLQVTYGTAAGLAISSILFGLVHGNPAALSVYVWMGLVYAFVYHRSGSMWAPISCHVLNNAVAMAALLITL